jgi:hypothetical protein
VFAWYACGFAGWIKLFDDALVPIPEDVHTHFHCMEIYIYIICGMVIHLIWDSRTNGCIMLQYLMTFDDHPWTSPNISKQFGQASCLDLISCHLARTRLAWAVHLPGDLNSATLIYGKTWHWCPSIHCSIILCPKLTEMRIQTLTVCRHTHVMLFVISPIHTPVIN